MITAFVVCAGISFSAKNETVFSATFEESNAAASKNGKVSPDSGSGRITDFGGKKGLDCINDFRILKYPIRSMLPDAEGSIGGKRGRSGQTGTC